MTIKIDTFAGMIPAVAEDKLPLQNASSCSGCFFDRSRLEAIRLPEPVKTVSSSQDIVSIHRTSRGAWQWWTEIAHVCRSPITDNDHYLLTTSSASPQQFTHSEAVSGSRRPLGLPAPSAAMDIEIMGSGNGTIDASVSYVYTLVTDQGEESASSMPTAVVEVEEGQSVRLSGIVNVAPAGSCVTAFRIYRLQGNEYLYVGEIPVSTHSYTDADPGSELNGDVLATEKWTPPPAAMQGLISFGQGTYAGFVDKDVYISETFIPYAYPSGYSRSVNAPIVGLAPVQGGLIVLTTDKPELMQGIDPATILQQELGVELACVSARSIAATDGGVFFATERGIAFISSAGQPTLLTAKVFTEKQWQDLFPDPSRIIGMLYHGDYLFCSQGERTVYSLSTSAGTVVPYVLDHPVTCLWYDGTSSRGYLVAKNGSASTILSWRTGERGMYSWTSKRIYLPSGVTPTCARIDSDFSLGPVTFSLEADGTTYFPATEIGSDTPFRLPQGTVKRVTLTLSGASPVVGVAVAGSIAEIKEV